MAIDQKILGEYGALDGDRGFHPVVVDAWSPAETRCDRYYDDTHVYPTTFYPTVETDFPRLLASTQTNFIKHCVCHQSSSEH
jgi:hypothetical protein